MTSLNLIIRLDGPQSNEGIDLFEFAPNVLSLGQVIKESGKELGIGKEIGINIKPIERGSFIVELALFSQTQLGELLNFIQNNDVQNIKELLEWLGIIAKVTGSGALGCVSLYKLIKFLNKKPPQSKEKIEGGKIKYTNHDGQQIIVNGEVDKLYNNPIIHQHYYGAFKSLEKEGIDTFEAYIKEEPETKQVITEDDLPFIESYSNSELSSQEEVGQESIYETSLNFKRGSYEGESAQWSFRKGPQIIIAVIRDESFLEKIKTGEIRPYAKDFLRVKMREVPRMIGTDITGFNYEILEVIDYKIHKDNKLF